MISTRANTIKDWCKEVHDVAMKHGWWDNPRETPELLCLIHSEISEGLEAYRREDMNLFREEMADVAIRLFDLCREYNIDLEWEIYRKNEKNKARPYRHGNKKC